MYNQIDNMVHADCNVSSTTETFLRLVEPPKESFIFRYDSDVKRHGHLGDISVELNYFNGSPMEEIKFVCTLHRPDNALVCLHELVNHSGGGAIAPKYGHAVHGCCTVNFTGIVVLNRYQKTIKKEIRNILAQRNVNLTSDQIRQRINQELNDTNLKKVQLRFDAYRKVNANDWVPICQPILSNYIRNKRKGRDSGNTSEVGSSPSSGSPQSLSTNRTDTNSECSDTNNQSYITVLPNENVNYCPGWYPGAHTVSSTTIPHIECEQHYAIDDALNSYDSTCVGFSEETENTSNYAAVNPVSSTTEPYVHNDDCDSSMHQVMNWLWTVLTNDSINDLISYSSSFPSELPLSPMLSEEDRCMDNALYREIENYDADCRMETDGTVSAGEASGEDSLIRSSLLMVMVMYKICHIRSSIGSDCMIKSEKIRRLFKNEYKNGRFYDILVTSYPETFKLFVTCVDELKMVDLLNIEPDNQRSCLHTVCKTGTVDVISATLPTLIRLGLNPNEVDDRGDSVLHALIRKNHSTKCVDILLKSSDDNNVQLDMQIVNDDGLTPMQLAKMLKRTGVVKALKRASAQNCLFPRLQDGIISGVRKLWRNFGRKI